MYEIGKFIGSLIAIVGSVHVLGWLIAKAGKFFERREKYIEGPTYMREVDQYRPYNGGYEDYRDLSRKVDWLCQMQMARMHRFEEPPIETNAYYVK